MCFNMLFYLLFFLEACTHKKKAGDMYIQHMFGLTCVFCAKVSLFSLVHVEQKLYLCNIILGNASTASYWKTIKKNTFNHAYNNSNNMFALYIGFREAVFCCSTLPCHCHHSSFFALYRQGLAPAF